LSVEKFLTPQRIVLPSASVPLDCSILKMALQNIRNYFPRNKASHPRTHESPMLMLINLSETDLNANCISGQSAVLFLTLDI
jgi:hypothetical protein